MIIIRHRIINNPERMLQLDSTNYSSPLGSGMFFYTQRKPQILVRTACECGSVNAQRGRVAKHPWKLLRYEASLHNPRV